MVTKSIRFGCRIGHAISGIVIGISAGAAFGPVLKNPDAAIFGVFSGIVAAIVLMVHILYVKRLWTAYEHRSLIFLMYLGCFVQLIGVCSFVVYIVLGCIAEPSQTDHLLVKGRSFFLVSVWCFMTWKWGFFLFLHSRRYRRELTKTTDDVPILE